MILDKSEQPDEREAINADRDGKLGRFEPRRRTRDDPVVHEYAHEGGKKSDEHRPAQNGQRRVGGKCAM